MAAADKKITYTAAEAGAHEWDLANAQRAAGGPVRRAIDLSEDQMSLFNEAEICQDSKAEEPTEKPLP